VHASDAVDEVFALHASYAFPVHCIDNVQRRKVPRAGFAAQDDNVLF